MGPLGAAEPPSHEASTKHTRITQLCFPLGSLPAETYGTMGAGVLQGQGVKNASAAWPRFSFPFHVDQNRSHAARNTNPT